MMTMLYFFFQKPMSWAILAATAVFTLLYLLSRSRRSLSLVIYISILIEIVFVSLHFTARMNNIVILKDISYQLMNYGMLLLWISFLLEKDGFKIVPNHMNAAVFIFFAVCVLTAYTAHRMFWYYAVEWASRFGASVALFFLIVHFINTRKRWNITLHVLLAMMVITSIYCVMQLNGYDFMSWGRIVNVSTFGNKDFAASFWTYTAPIALFMAIGARNLFDGALYMAMAGVGLYNIWIGQTRGAWVGLMALGAVTFVYESKFGRLAKWLGNWKKQLIFWGAVLVVIVAVVPLFMSPTRLETFQSIFQFHGGTNIIRVYMWWTGWRMWLDSPVLGQGLGVSHVTYPFFRPDRYHRIGMSHNTDYVHSEELQFLCEQGIVGFSAWLAMLTIFFYMCYKKLKSLDDISERYTLFGVAGALFAAVVHDSMNVNLRWTSSMIAFWAVLALGTRYCVGFDAPEERKAILKEARRKTGGQGAAVWAMFPVVAAGFAFVAYGQYRVLRGDWALKTTEDTSGSTAVAAGIDTLKHNPYSHSAYYKLAYQYLQENRIYDALHTYEGLLNVAPNYAQTHQNTGLIFYRLFGNTNKKSYLYQSVLEFEWATILENNFDNHTKLLQLHTQLLNNASRGRYHNEYIFWNMIEDSFFNLWYFYIHYWQQPLNKQTPDWKQNVYDAYMKSIDDASRAYWLYRTDTVRRVGRPKDEVRYAMKMSTRFEHQNMNLLQYAVGSLIGPAEIPPGDMMYLISIIEEMDPRVPLDLFAQIRQTLITKSDGKQLDPLMAYAIGALSYRLGDQPSAKTYFQMARAMGESRYQFIRDGLKRYNI